METIRIHSRVGQDGILKLEVPTSLVNTDLEVVVVMQPASVTDDLGWPVGFFERTYGAFADDPLERPDQGIFEVREPLE
ncbi:MAG: hypothetical protein JXM73_18525 [Anaerolineae bacterium]|nr:hypothetical protein [Anaerolineae bacterium]